MNRWSVTILILVVVIASLAAFLDRRSSVEGVLNPPERTVSVAYQFTIQDIPENAKQVFVWVPIPPSNKHQRMEGFQVEGDWSYKVLTEQEYGNRFIRFDLSRKVPEDDKDISIRVNFKVNRKAYRALEDTGDAEIASAAKLIQFLQPNRLVPIDGEIAEEAKRIAGGEKDPLLQTRRLYNHIVKTVRYDKSGEGWGRGDAVYTCSIRRGNCTDFHSLFIGEARSLGIPARFIMGLPILENKSEGEIPGYHCWIEFHIKGKGWIPVDASEASKFPKKKEAFFGGLDANRVAFTMGRDIQLPGASAPPLNYVIYPHVEVDGQTHKKVKAHFSFREATSG